MQDVTPFGTLSDGRAVQRVEIASDALSVALLDLGALVHDVRLEGVDHALTLGSPDLRAYEGVMSHFGAIMGPVANRISGAEAEIDGRTYRFEANQDGRHTRHAGAAGTHRKVWRIDAYGADHVTFGLDLPDGEGGFPGNRALMARYRVEGRVLHMELRAATDAPTLINLANHAYWTLHNSPDWGGQTLRILADRYLPTTDENLPTGEIADVAGTAYDFRDPRSLTVGETPKLDTNFCLADAPRPLTPALSLAAPSGLTLEVATTAPGLQVFDMGSFGAYVATHHGRPYAPRAALAFEPQLWPDAPGRAAWPDIVLRPGETFAQATSYTLSGN